MFSRSNPRIAANRYLVKIPKPKDTEESGSDETQKKDEAEGQLPQTLVRIPTEHAPMLQQQPGASGGSGE